LQRLEKGLINYFGWWLMEEKVFLADLT